MSSPLKKFMSGVILDLDGTLLNTDGVVSDVLKVCLVKYGKQWDGREGNRIVGKTPKEAAAAVVEEYELPCATDELVAQINPLFSEQMCKIKALPGANRLLKHLSGHNVPMALASNSPRANIESKISYHQGWKELFSVIIGGDEVRCGKPSPEIFLEAARRLNIEPSNCLVIEDSLPGVTGGKAAGMEVIAVPSIPKQSHLYTAADEVINSLLDLRPEKWGLPAFQDWIEGTLPLEPWHIGGPVIKGYGRGSKVLGIPTANLSTEDHSEVLSQHPSGVYFGWASLSTRGVYKMVMSIGWNPVFNNTEKTIEPWLLHEFNEDFYGEELRLVIVGYIRPEMENTVKTYKTFTRWVVDWRVFDNLVSHLKTVEIVGLAYRSNRDSYNNVLYFVKFLLKNASLLEKIVLLEYPGQKMDFAYKVRKDLSRIRKSSPHVIIKVARLK